MKNLKKTISLLLAVIIMATTFTALPFTASAAENLEMSEVGASSGTTGDCTWTLDNKGTLTISGNGKMGDYLYTTAATEAPWGANIKSVVIENGVTSIGDCAFYGCTGLTSVTIGNSVTSIGLSAFGGCTGLTSVTIPDSVTIIGVHAFSGCTGLTSVTIGNSVTIISWHAFDGCTGLTSVTIPDSVTSIDGGAFYDCTGLTSVTIPDSVTSIGGEVFSYCTGLTSITVNSNNPVYNSQNNCNAIIETNSNTLILGCVSTVIPDGVTSIGDNAFSGCTNLTSVTIPDSVTSIGSNAFCDCNGLKSITIPDSVTSIGGSAFFRCTDLTSVTIPDSVTWIGRRATGYYFDTNTWKYEKVDGFTIYGVKGSEAEKYANDNGFIFKEIGSESSKPIGDANGDNTVDVLDAAAVQKHASGKAELNSDQLVAADVNGDGNVDVLDAADIQKFAAGIISEFKKKV